MRIAMYSDQFFPELSGITDSIITTGETLRGAGHEVVYIAPRYARRDYEKAAPLQEERSGSAYAMRERLPVLRMPSVGIPGSPNGQGRLAFPLGTTLRALYRFKPDVIHTHAPFGAGLEALVASRLLRIPLIGTNHTPIEQYVPRLLAPIARRYYAWYYRHCDFVSTPYPGLIDDMRAVGLTAPAKVVSNPVSLDSFTVATDKTRAAAKERLGLVGSVILYAGRLSPEKRVNTVIRAIAAMRDDGAPATLLIAGHGSERGNLERLSHEFGIEKQVRFLGFIDPAALPEVYHAADAFAIMSHAETQSLVLMQAYASGLPAAIADTGALPYYAAPGASALVSDDDARELARRLHDLLGQDRLRVQEAARAFAARFAPASIAQEWAAIYTREIAARRR